MKFLVLGAGSWGLAMAQHLAGLGQQVHLHCRTQAQVERLYETRQDPRLPGRVLHSSLSFGSDLSASLVGVDCVILGCPSHALRTVAAELAAWVPKGPAPSLVSLIKGIEPGTHLRVSEILLQEIPWATADLVATLSGPSHAEEVAAGLLTSVVVACPSDSLVGQLQKAMNNERFRVYGSRDVAGVEIAGAVKNVIAIATGILDGLGFGDNAKGALLSRGLVELSRLGQALGAEEKTLFGLSGLGDLVTTCISKHSRNRYVGEQLGVGRSLDEILSEMNMVAEGVNTARATLELAQSLGVEMPITQAVCRVLFEGGDPMEAALSLMRRDPKMETL